MQIDTFTTRPLSQSRVLLLGSGELGKEIAIELLRLGQEVVACDQYDHAPAMQVAHKKEIFNMLDGDKLKEIVEKHQPTLIVPEVEAIATSALIELEDQGYKVIPNARATQITMNREKIRLIAHDELGLATVKFAFAGNLTELKEQVQTWDYPLVIKPIMSSSGKGQSVIYSALELEQAWHKAIAKGRGDVGRVIVEEFVEFESEITLLTLRTVNGSTLFCDPIGHEQIDGDYIRSWQPHHLSTEQWQQAKNIAQKVTDYLGGCGIFGVELFLLKSGKILFNEVSPRPHDTGMVTMVTQPWSEFALHVRAILGWPIKGVTRTFAGASRALKASQESNTIIFEHVEEAMQEPGVDLRIFGKTKSYVGRRMGVLLASGEDIRVADEKINHAQKQLQINYHL